LAFASIILCILVLPLLVFGHYCLCVVCCLCLCVLPVSLLLPCSECHVCARLLCCM
jgi:hypothetical protein